MKRGLRLLILLCGGGAVALGAELTDPGTAWAALALIGGAIAAGELARRRMPDGSIDWREPPVAALGRDGRGWGGSRADAGANGVAISAALIV